MTQKGNSVWEKIPEHVPKPKGHMEKLGGSGLEM
jgi:hypothetical protein